MTSKVARPLRRSFPASFLLFLLHLTAFVRVAGNCGCVWLGLPRGARLLLLRSLLLQFLCDHSWVFSHLITHFLPLVLLLLLQW